MSQNNFLSSGENNFISSGEFQYTPSNNLTTLQNVYVPQPNNIQNIILDDLRSLKSEIMSIKEDLKNLKEHHDRSLKSEILSVKDELKSLKDDHKRSITKLTEEVIVVKKENRDHHKDITAVEDFQDFKSLPYNTITEFVKLDEEIQRNEDTLKKFKEFIAKTGGDGSAKFLRAAVRKIFSDELASAYSWKGTSSKPSAEKSFLITTIKNICHIKYKATDQEMNGVLQKHFVHARDRLGKRKHQTGEEQMAKNPRT